MPDKNLRDILGSEEYERIGRRVELRLEKAKKEKQKREELKNRKLQERQKREEDERARLVAKREEIVDFLYSFDKDPICQKVLELKGKIPVYHFGLFSKLKILFVYRGGPLIDEFPICQDGTINYRKVHPSGCAMGGSYESQVEHKRYYIENMVKDVTKFKKKVSKNLLRKITEVN